MAKTFKPRSNKKRSAFMLMITSVAVVAAAAVGVTSASFYRQEHVDVNASDANLKADIYVGEVADDLGLTADFKDITTLLASVGSLAPKYQTTPLTVTDGVQEGETAVAMYTDNFGESGKGRFKDFAPGQVRAISYKINNTGKVDIKLDLALLAKHVVPTTPLTADTWDEQDPTGVFETQFLVTGVTAVDEEAPTKHAGTFTAKLAAAAKLSTFNTKANVVSGDDSIVIEVGKSVELIQLVAFPDDSTRTGATPNKMNDNKYMNSLFDFTLYFEMYQDGTPTPEPNVTSSESSTEATTDAPEVGGGEGGTEPEPEVPTA